MGFWSWLRGAFGAAAPPAFMSRPGVSGPVTLYWPKGTQVDVYLASGEARLWNLVQDSTIFWNVAIGRRFFAPPMAVEVNMARAFADPTLRPSLRGVVLVCLNADPTDSNHGTSDIQYDMRTGEMHSIVVTLPTSTNRPVDVAKHELGHVCCLDHGPEGSLMAAHLPPAGKALSLAAYQLSALRAMAGG